ncbi:MAG: hypothetical protein KY475_15380 [Planctomycetes bacterium]|nr:hypothetical protein [Planctomycetota bacterium]
MNSAPLELLRRGEFLCPACGARQAWSDTCRRCRCNLDLFHRTAAARLETWQRCLRRLTAGDAAAALVAAEQGYALAPTHEAARLLAMCRLVNRDFSGALALHPRANSSPEPEGDAPATAPRYTY